jgi:hypothetical protein
MKKLLYIALSFFLLTGSINVAQASEKGTKELTEEQKVKIEQIVKRVDEIRDLDRSKMNKAEKKALRSELSTLKNQANAISNGGVYLSLTALLVIIILLLIL